MKLTTVAFDIGNVLVGFDRKPVLRKMFSDPETVRAVDEAIWGSGLWNEMDRGILNEDEIAEEMVLRDPAHEKEIREAFFGCGPCFHRKDYAIPWIESLKADGYRVLYLSNYSEHAKKAAPEVLDFVPHMDGGIWSCDTGIVKPFRKIYRLLTEKYDLSPEECVFLDDREANVNAARSFGMKGIVFQEADPESSWNDLQKLLHQN